MKRRKHIPVSFVVETYKEPRAEYFIVDSVPSCFNDIVRVRRYRISVEEIVEAPEVIQERLNKLYTETNNMHHRLSTDVCGSARPTSGQVGCLKGIER